MFKTNKPGQPLKFAIKWERRPSIESFSVRLLFSIILAVPIQPAYQIQQIHQIQMTTGKCNPSGLHLQVSVATTPEEQARGLSNRTSPLSSSQAMLFLYKEPGPKTFWMKETFIPLSLFFFDADGKLLSAQQMTVEKDPAHPTKLYSEPADVAAVVEAAPEILSSALNSLRSLGAMVLCFDDQPLEDAVAGEDFFGERLP